MHPLFLLLLLYQASVYIKSDLIEPNAEELEEAIKKRETLLIFLSMLSIKIINHEMTWTITEMNGMTRHVLTWQAISKQV